MLEDPAGRSAERMGADGAVYHLVKPKAENVTDVQAASRPVADDGDSRGLVDAIRRLVEDRAAKLRTRDMHVEAAKTAEADADAITARLRQISELIPGLCDAARPVMPDNQLTDHAFMQQEANRMASKPASWAEIADVRPATGAEMAASTVVDVREAMRARVLDLLQKRGPMSLPNLMQAALNTQIAGGAMLRKVLAGMLADKVLARSGHARGVRYFLRVQVPVVLGEAAAGGGPVAERGRVENQQARVGEIRRRLLSGPFRDASASYKFQEIMGRVSDMQNVVGQGVLAVLTDMVRDGVLDVRTTGLAREWRRRS